MNPWSVQQYNDIRSSLLEDIDSLSKRLSGAKTKVKEVGSKERHVIEDEAKRLEKYLAEANESLKRFEFRYTHDGRTPEEWSGETSIEEAEGKRRKRTKYPKDIDFNTLVVINPKTNKPYPVYKLKALYRDGKLGLSEQ